MTLKESMGKLRGFRLSGRRRRTLTAAVAIVSAASLTAACGAGTSTGGEGGSDSAIVVGTIGAMSGPSSSLAAITYGLQAYFQKVDAEGGINGHQIKVVVGDDQFNPALTPGVASKLVGQDHVQMMCGIAGSADVAAIKPFLAQANVPSVAPASGSPNLVQPVTPTEYETVPAYEPLAAQLVDYAVNTLHKKKIAIAYTSDDVGLPALAGVEWELKKLGLPLAAKVEFSLTATSLASQAAKLKASGADFVILWHVATALSLMVNNANQIGYHPTWGSGFFSATPAYIQLTKNSTDGNAYFESWLNSPTADQSATYRAAMQKYQPKTDYNDINAMQGWSLADTCGNLIKQATAGGKEFNSTNLAAAGNAFKLDDDYIHGLNWTAGSHTGVTQAQVLLQKGGKFTAVTPYKTLPNAPTTAG